MELQEPSIVVYKSSKTLELYENGKLLRSIAVTVGKNAGDKEIEGDMKTPEGEFYICMKNDKSAFYLSLGLSYPNIEDAQRGRASGLIDEAQFVAIIEAIHKKECPDWYTPLGGEIFIHGNGPGKGFTLGCIAMPDPEIKLLFEQVKLGTPVTIRP